ncbi:MAG: type II secretion system minor pseudopilin GspI [Roseovarius sp.]
MRPRQRRTSNRTTHRGTLGLTLLELVVAVMILSVGSIAALRATDQSRVAIGGMPSRVLAQIVARNRVQELQLYGAVAAGSLPGEVEMGGRRFQVSVDTTTTAGGLARAAITVRGPDGPGTYLVAYVTPLGSDI